MEMKGSCEIEQDYRENSREVNTNNTQEEEDGRLVGDLKIEFDSDNEPNYDEIASHIINEFKKNRNKRGKKSKKFKKREQLRTTDDYEYQFCYDKSKNIMKNGQISKNDIGEIIMIVLLILILGVSLFRVILEVQNMYKKAEHSLTDNSISDARSQAIPIPPIKKQQQNALNNQLEKKNPTLVKDEFEKTKQEELKKKQGNWGRDVTLANSKQPQGKKDDNASPQVKKKEPLVIINLASACQKYISDKLSESGALYDFKYPNNEFRLKSRVQKYPGSRNTQIEKNQFSRTVDLVSAIHHITPNGEVVAEDTPCESEKQTKNRIQAALLEEKQVLEEKYQISQYQDKQLRFCIVTNSYMNAKKGLLYRNIDSILQQNYENYHVVYTDDFSDDNTGLKVEQYLKEKGIDSDKVSVSINDEKKGMMENIYNAITYECELGEIAVMLDGDDSFIGRQVLSLLNAVYQRDKNGVTWLQFVSIFGNGQANMGFSRGYNDRQVKSKSYRKMKSFISSHLKTFWVDIFREIKVQDLQENDGKFFGGASDTAMMMSVLELATPRVKYIPQIVYEYRYDTGLTGNSMNRAAQKRALKQIFQTPPYLPLVNFDFIDEAIERAQSFKNISSKD